MGLLRVKHFNEGVLKAGRGGGNVLAEAVRVTCHKYLLAKLCLIAEIYLTRKLVPAMQM